MVAEVVTLTEKVRGYNPSADIDLVQRAFEFARTAHTGQYRDTGDSFISHPLGVAQILADLHLDVPTIAAALLHDVVEDTPVRNVQIRATFGDEIYALVEGVTKLSKVDFKTEEEKQAENLRKMLLAMAKDIRVVLIKLADRLHNMRTLNGLTEDRQIIIAKETQEIFAPLAHRLGISQIKWELEDYAFRYLEPEKYHELAGLVSKKRAEREKSVQAIVARMRSEFEKASLRAEVTGRPKHLFSIYTKMRKLSKDFSEIYDVSAVRVIVDSVTECYRALGIVHSVWKPIPGNFDDYIAVPKSNGYQSLHTAVMGEVGEPLEVQLRTWEMHHRSEFGIAAHWKYKLGVKDEQFEEKFAWMRQLLEWHREMASATEFVNTLKVDLFEDEVFVFTPKGDVIQLPSKSSPVDFAYRIHTQVGHRTMGAKVNGKIIPLDSMLKHGDIVEILTTKEEHPSMDWLTFVCTSQARSKIRSWFKQRNREQSIQEGRVLLEKEIKRRGVDSKEILKEEYVSEVVKKYNRKSQDDLFASVGYGDLSYQTVFNQLKFLHDEEKKKQAVVQKEQQIVLRRRQVRSGQGVRVEGETDILVRFSKCCSPVPGEKITGFITKGRGVTVHRVDCSNVKLLTDLKQNVMVEWDVTKEILCPVEIEVRSNDKVGLLNEVTSCIREFDTNVSSASVKTFNGFAKMNLVLEVNNAEKLRAIMHGVRKIQEVTLVQRV